MFVLRCPMISWGSPWILWVALLRQALVAKNLLYLSTTPPSILSSPSVSIHVGWLTDLIHVVARVAIRACRQDPFFHLDPSTGKLQLYVQGACIQVRFQPLCFCRRLAIAFHGVCHFGMREHLRQYVKRLLNIASRSLQSCIHVCSVVERRE